MRLQSNIFRPYLVIYIAAEKMTQKINAFSYRVIISYGINLISHQSKKFAWIKRIINRVLISFSCIYFLCHFFSCNIYYQISSEKSWLKSHNQRVIISYGINLISNDVGIWSIIIAYEEKTLIKMHSYKISKASEHQKTVFLRNYQWNDWLRISILSDFYPIPTVRFTSSKKMFHIRYSI